MTETGVSIWVDLDGSNVLSAARKLACSFLSTENIDGVPLLTVMSHPRISRVIFSLHLHKDYKTGRGIILMLTSLDEPAS